MHVSNKPTHKLWIILIMNGKFTYMRVLLVEVCCHCYAHRSLCFRIRFAGQTLLMEDNGIAWNVIHTIVTYKAVPRVHKDEDQDKWGELMPNKICSLVLRGCTFTSAVFNFIIHCLISDHSRYNFFLGSLTKDLPRKLLVKALINSPQRCCST